MICGYRNRAVNAGAILVAATLPSAAHAAGTVAGTLINNTATASYTDPGGNPVSVPSNQISLRVDEILNVTVASADPGDVAVTPGATGRTLKYTVTNSGNGSEGFTLSAINAIGGDNFDPTTTQVVIDVNGNGSYDPGTDTVYAAGSEPVLAPDASIQVLLLSTIPAGATDTQRGATDLRAAAVKGTGAAGTVFAGQGIGGGDAVVGTTTAAGTARGYYLVSAASVAFVKSASVLDPFGGSRNLPGSIITYTLTATVSGSGSIANLSLADPVPATTTYQAGTLTLAGAALTDAADGDAGEVSGAAGSQSVAARLGAVAAGGSRVVTFKVKIN